MSNATSGAAGWAPNTMKRYYNKEVKKGSLVTMLPLSRLWAILRNPREGPPFDVGLLRVT